MAQADRRVQGPEDSQTDESMSVARSRASGLGGCFSGSLPCALGYAPQNSQVDCGASRSHAAFSDSAHRRIEPTISTHD
jgi:hypothetical protein